MARKWMIGVVAVVVVLVSGFYIAYPSLCTEAIAADEGLESWVSAHKVERCDEEWLKQNGFSERGDGEYYQAFYTPSEHEDTSIQLSAFVYPSIADEELSVTATKQSYYTRMINVLLWWVDPIYERYEYTFSSGDDIAVRFMIDIHRADLASAETIHNRLTAQLFGKVLQMPKKVTTGKDWVWKETVFSCKDGRTLLIHKATGDEEPQPVKEVALTAEQIEGLNVLYGQINTFAPHEDEVVTLPHIPLTIELHDGTVHELTRGCAAQQELNTYIELLEVYDGGVPLRMPEVIAVNGCFGETILVKPKGERTIEFYEGEELVSAVTVTTAECNQLNFIYDGLEDFSQSEEWDSTTIVALKKDGQTYQFAMDCAADPDVNAYIDMIFSLM